MTIYLFSYRILNSQIAWLAFPIGLLFLKWFDLAIIQGFQTLKSFSRERIELNLKAAGISDKKDVYKIEEDDLILIGIIGIRDILKEQNP
jgi:hypothetical protein